MRKFLQAPLTVFQVHNFRYFWGSSLLYQLGNQMLTVASAWQLYQLVLEGGFPKFVIFDIPLGGAAIALGLVGLFSFLPILFFSLIGGVIADRVNRKNLLIFCKSIQVVLAFALFAVTALDMMTPLVIYVSVFLAGTLLAFSAPARQSLVFNIVPESLFLNATSLFSLGRQIAVISGPTVAGFMIEFTDISSVYFAVSAAFAASLLLIFPIKVTTSENEGRGEFSFDAVLEGIKFVRNEPIIYSTMFLDFFATFFSAATTLMPIFATEVLKTGAKGLGILYAAPSVGGVLAGLLLSNIKFFKYPGKAILVSVLVYGLATVGFGLSGNFYLSVFCLFFLGAGDMVSTILRQTIRQLVTPDWVRGRMTSVNMLFAMGGPKLGEVESGLAASAIGAPAAVVLGGVATIILSVLVAVTSPRLRNFRN